MSANLLSPCIINTDELKDSYVNLHDVIVQGEEKTCIFRWTIRNYKLLSFGLEYNAHYIRIGDSLHRLRVLKVETKFTILPVNNKLVYVYLGVTPSTCAHVTLSILKNDLEEMLPLSSAGISLQNLVNRECYWGFIEPPMFLTDSYNPTVLCRITVRVEVPVSIYKPNSISLDFGKLFADGLFSDITIRVADKEFEAHSAILAARSPVFEAMLRSDMKEKAKREVKIVDFAHDVFEDFLWYLYTGKTRKLEVNNAIQLLYLSDKYDVKDLKQELEEFLRSSMSVPQVLKIIVAANFCNAKNLKEDSLLFIIYNLKGVMEWNEWKTFRSHFDLVDDILRYMSSEFGR